MNSTIDNLNYATDPRTQTPVEIPTITMDITCPTCEGTGNNGWLDDERPYKCTDCDEGTQYDVEIELPWKFDVCHVCEGNGTHVNPSIDAGGLTAEDFHDDPEFAESYMSGRYDVVCNNCHGKRVEPVVDSDRLTDAERVAWHGQLDADAEYNAERLAEIRMGC